MAEVDTEEVAELDNELAPWHLFWEPCTNEVLWGIRMSGTGVGCGAF